MSQPLEAFKNAFKIPELKSRIIFTLIMLAIYRLGCHVPAPGIDGGALAQKISQGGGLLGFYDMFSGGAFARATVFTLGIMPYITASIILSLLIPIIPALEKLQKEGHQGQQKINDYTRYGTVVLCIIQSLGISWFLQGLGREIVPNPGPMFLFTSVLSFTTGAAFVMWIGEQVSEFGIGNGMSLIIFTSIVSRMPAALRHLFQLVFVSKQLNMFQALILVFLMIVVIAGAIAITTGQRRIPVQYPRQVKGKRVSGGQKTYLPLRVNQAGVIPIIFASSILSLPAYLGDVVRVPVLEWVIREFFYPGNPGYAVCYGGLIIFFSFFYTAITFNPVEIADNMKKYGGVIVGVRPGKATAEYLNHVMTRITLAGSIFLAVIALLPEGVYYFIKVPDWTIVQFFGGTSLLILVGVALDTVKQIEQHLLMRHYDGFGGKTGRIRSRRTF